MTKSNKCSANYGSCKGKPIRAIWVLAKSPSTQKEYTIGVNVCKKHYDDEKKANAIIKEQRRLLS